ncbi:MAG: sel1 repeat family protein [Butyrivibrio sp.]|nr:sel1 repeat family protein [Butyrivibrio sp.]
MKDEDLTLWEDNPATDEQELTLWEDATEDEQELSLWEEEKVLGQNGSEKISLWSDAKELPPISQLLIREENLGGISLPEGFEDWKEVVDCFIKYYNKDADLGIDESRPLTKSLEGAALYGSDDSAKQWEGSELISDAANRKDAVGMRQRAVVLLEGLVCERDPESALKWLHMAVRAGDIKALRILVYSLYGMEKILVAPRENAKAGDNEGRSIKISDLFDGVTVSEKDKLHYVRRLIDLTEKYYSIDWGDRLIKGSHYKDRPLLTLVYGYLTRLYEIDKTIPDSESVLNKWGNELYAEIKKEPLYDGLLIPERESETRQIDNLCRIFDVEEEDLAQPLSLSWNPIRLFPKREGDFVNLIRDNAYGNNREHNFLIEKKEEIKNWTWRKLRRIVCDHDPEYFFAPFYVCCMEAMVEKLFKEGINYSEKNGIRKIQDVKNIFNTVRFLGKTGSYRYGYGDFNKSYWYEYFIEKEKLFWEMADRIPDLIIEKNKIKKVDIKTKEEVVRENVSKYSKYFSADEFNALKEAAAGSDWKKEAAYLLGLRYEYGQGTEADWGEAVKCFEIGQEGMFKKNSKKHLDRLQPQVENFRELKNLLPVLHSPQAATAAARIEQLSQRGLSPAKFLMAKQMLEPNVQKRENFIFPYDPERGLKLLEQAADKGNYSAMYELVLIGRNCKYNFDHDEFLANKYQSMQEKALEEDLRIE